MNNMLPAWDTQSKHCCADNGVFAANPWQAHCIAWRQGLTFAAVGGHHQNGVAENKIRLVHGQKTQSHCFAIPSSIKYGIVASVHVQAHTRQLHYLFTVSSGGENVHRRERLLTTTQIKLKAMAAAASVGGSRS